MSESSGLLGFSNRPFRMICNWSPSTSNGDTLLRSSGMTCLRFQSPQANWKKLSQGSVVRSIAPRSEAAVWTHSGVRQIGVDSLEAGGGKICGDLWGEVRKRQGCRKQRMRMRTRQRRRIRMSPHRSHAVRCLRQATTFALAQEGQRKVEEVSAGRDEVSTEIRPSALAPRKLCSSTHGSSGSRVLVREGRGEVLVEVIGILVCGCHQVLWPPQMLGLPQIHHSDLNECFILSSDRQC